MGTAMIKENIAVLKFKHIFTSRNFSMSKLYMCVLPVSGDDKMPWLLKHSWALPVLLTGISFFVLVKCALPSDNADALSNTLLGALIKRGRTSRTRMFFHQVSTDYRWGTNVELRECDVAAFTIFAHIVRF